LDWNEEEIKRRYIHVVKHLKTARYPEEKEFWEGEYRSIAFAAEQKHSLDLKKLDKFL
tara:strand:+ start:915 stop:1088 length:174 start_codon:yes stop_codon:yes gene_type:complete